MLPPSVVMQSTFLSQVFPNELTEQSAYILRAPPQTNATPFVKSLIAPTTPKGYGGKDMLEQVSFGQNTSILSRYLKLKKNNKNLSPHSNHLKRVPKALDITI